MTEYDNNFTGAIFKNDKKATEKHPDYTGSATIDGIEYWQSVWVKTSKSGAKFFSQSFRRKDEAQPPSKPASKPAPSHADPFGDDVPF